jgi:hypothetical protein
VCLQVQKAFTEDARFEHPFFLAIGREQVMLVALCWRTSLFISSLSNVVQVLNAFEFWSNSNVKLEVTINRVSKFYAHSNSTLVANIRVGSVRPVGRSCADGRDRSLCIALAAVPHPTRSSAGVLSLGAGAPVRRPIS